MKKNKEIILVIGNIVEDILEELIEFKKDNPSFQIALAHKKEYEYPKELSPLLKKIDLILKINFNNEKSIVDSLEPFKNKIRVITTRSESSMPLLKKLIPYLPYLNTPTEESIDWSTNKILMRNRFNIWDKSITPEHMVAINSQKKTIENLSKNIGYPMVVKPTGLAQSILVNLVYHKDELKKELSKVLRTIKKSFKSLEKKDSPSVLVEQFMSGDMYSVDVYINSKGKIYYCPPVEVRTGRTVGFDDFFGYIRILPSNLNNESINSAYEVTKKAVRAVALRSSSAHVELMKTEQGWKVIELGPRIGGFRNIMYRLSYSIKHVANDILVRLPRTPIIPEKLLGHTAVIQLFAKEEGYIKTLTGIKKIQELESFYTIDIHKKVGDKAVFAKNGGKSVFDITLFNKDRSKLLADIRRLEQSVNIETTRLRNELRNNK